MEKTRHPFIVPVFLPHAGCPHRCVFCNQHAVTGTPLLPTISDFESTIRRFLGYVAGRPADIQIAFYGGNFLGLSDPEVVSLLSMAQRFVRDGRADSIRFSTRPDSIDDHRLDLISRFSVRTVELGVQSLDETVLNLSRRGHTIAHTIAAVERLRERDVTIGLQMMVGLPGDSIRRSIGTARQMIDLQPEFVRIYPTVVLENSLLATWYKKGKFDPWSLETSVAFVKELYLLFKQNNIPVIRMGLQAEEDFGSGKAIIAGPYHPAFGHLVHSKIYLDAAMAALKSSLQDKEDIRIYVHPKSISRMRGHKNHNISKLQVEFWPRKVQVIPDPSFPEDCLQLEGSELRYVDEFDDQEAFRGRFRSGIN